MARPASDTLGTYTKSIHAQAGQGFPGSVERATKKAHACAGRYKLMQVAASLLWDSAKRDDWKAQHRTCWCSRSAKRESGSVGVFRNADGSGASLAGLNRCGEIWTCPVCAGRVAEERRAELSRGMAAHLDGEGAAYLVTLTFPHEADHNLFVMLERFAKARQSLQNSRTWKAIMSEAGRVGSVASLELTVSQEHGWHPHLHMLVFADRQGLAEGEPINVHGDLDSDAIRELRRTWVNILIKKGLGTAGQITDMMAHAFNVRGGDQAAEYVAKYGRDERHGASAEMTTSYTKRAATERNGLMHATPFMLLEWAERGDDWAACRFRDYAQALAGKRAITWSPGLKKHLGITERTDEEIAADDAGRPEQLEVGELDAEQFKDILRRARLPDFIRYVAECCSNQGDIDDYVDAIRALPQTRRGTVVQRGVFRGRYAID